MLEWQQMRPRLVGLQVAVGCVVALLGGLALYSAWPNAYPSYPSTAPRPPASGGLAWLHSDGAAILDSQGRQVLLRGMNVTGLLQAQDLDPGPPPTQNDFARMRAFGFDLVRLAISWSRLEPRQGIMSQAYLQEIKQTVDLAARFGIYTVVDMHNIDWSYILGGDGAPAWATATALSHTGPGPPPWNRHLAPAVIGSYGIFWLDLGWQDDVIQAWSAVVRELADDPAVAGFDLWNEPHPYPVPPGMFEHKFVLPFEARLIAQLASISSQHMWITEQTLDFGLPTYVGGLPYPNQVFSAHAFSTLLTPPWEKPVPQYEGPLQLLVNQSRTAGGAPWVGEVGAGRGSADESWLKREMGVLDTFHLGWAYWDWNERGPWAFLQEPELWNDVARAYPVATPGVLTALSYDPASGTLQVGFDGLTRGRTLDIAVPSVWKSWQVTSAGSAGSVPSQFNQAAGLLRVFLDDALPRHLVTVRFSS